MDAKKTGKQHEEFIEEFTRLVIVLAGLGILVGAVTNAETFHVVLRAIGIEPASETAAGRGFLAATGIVLVLWQVLGLLGVLSWGQRRLAESLVASLEAEAQAETAKAIEQIAKEPRSAKAIVRPEVRADWPGEVQEDDQEPVWLITPEIRPEAGQGPAPSEAAPIHDTRGSENSASHGSRTAGAVDRFYRQALWHANVWFMASVLAAIVGLIVIVWEVVRATDQPALEAIAKVVPGLITGAIAALFYRQSNATRKHAADLLTSTQQDRRSDTALTVLNSIQDKERREEIKGRFVMHLAGMSPEPRQPSATRSASAARSGRRSGKPAGDDVSAP
jgi:hypothetical protein